MASDSIHAAARWSRAMPAPDDAGRIERSGNGGGAEVCGTPSGAVLSSVVASNGTDRLDLTRPTDRASLPYVDLSPDRRRAGPRASQGVRPAAAAAVPELRDRVRRSRSTCRWPSSRMTKDLPGFDNAVIGFGVGIFFIGYLLLEIPGTLLVERWSARKWICRIMISWGIVAALTAFVKTPMQFYAVRFLLGLAEAGFFPGVIVYLTHWFPRRDRAQGPGLVLHRHAGRAVRQPEALVLPAPDRHHGDDRRRDGPAPRAPGDARLAVDVHRLGHPGGDPGDPGPVPAARLAQGRALARGRRARRPGAGAEAREGAAQGGARPHDASSAGPPSSQGPAAGRGLFLRRVQPATASRSSCPASWRSGTS